MRLRKRGNRRCSSLFAPNEASYYSSCVEAIRKCVVFRWLAGRVSGQDGVYYLHQDPHCPQQQHQNYAGTEEERERERVCVCVCEEYCVCKMRQAVEVFCSDGY